MQSYPVVAACAGYTINAVTSKALTLISGAPDTRAQNSLWRNELAQYYIVILRWPVGSRMLHQNTSVIRRVTTVRTERGVRLTVCQGDVS